MAIKGVFYLKVFFKTSYTETTSKVGQGTVLKAAEN